MTNMSTVRLDSMDTEAHQDLNTPTTEGKDDSSLAPASPARGTVRPISQLSHRLRNSWRKSFQQLSSNSLTKLSEEDNAENQAVSWKQAFGASRKLSEVELVREEGHGNEIDLSTRSADGAIEF